MTHFPTSRSRRDSGSRGPSHRPDKSRGPVKDKLPYLGRYTHRVELSNPRLVAITPETVTFRTTDGRTVTLHPHEFLRRLLLHVLPRGFVKIRQSGPPRRALGHGIVTRRATGAARVRLSPRLLSP